MFSKILKKTIICIGILALVVFAFLFLGKAPEAENIIWGVSFSQKQAELLRFSWKECYLAILDELGLSHLKIIVYWDKIELNQGEYFFDDLDFQIEEAEKRNINVILTLGKKVPRWPECHIPSWAEDLNTEEELLRFLEEVVLRYKESPAIVAWQIENEPFFNFGHCPEITEDFLAKEIDLVKSLDDRDIILSDAGTGGFWFKTGKLCDRLSISLYEKVWFEEFNSYVSYPFPPVHYWRKAQIIKWLFNKDVFCGELQAEPWGPVLIHELSLEEQEKTMNLEQFRKNISFAKKTGFNEFYLWGAEWWYWMKEKHQNPEIWEEAKSLISD